MDRSRPSVIVALIATAGCAPVGAGHPMVTDRPDFTESAVAVAPGRVQVEAGYAFTDVEDAERHDVGEALARVGVGGSVELRLGLGSYGIEHPAGSPSVRELTGASIGAKVRLPTAGAADDVALILATTVPIDNDLGDPGWTPSAVLAASRAVGSAGLGANLGYTDSETADGRGEILASVAVGFPLALRLGSFVEVYGHRPLGGGDTRAVMDAGLTLGIGPDVQLDLRVGRSVIGSVETTVGAGISLRR